MWVLEKSEKPVFVLKYGDNLKSTDRFDEYDFSCVVEDCGDGIALIKDAVGSAQMLKKLHEGLEAELKKIGFTEVRWIRVIRKKIQG